MEKLAFEDLMNPWEYERRRKEFRQQVIELKRARRVQLGERLSLVFENRETMLFQVQEMLRAERIIDEEAILEELAIYNGLLPDAGELSATLFIEVSERSQIPIVLGRLQGIEHRIAFELGGGLTVPGEGEEGRSKEEKTSSVHYLRFRFGEPEREAFLDLASPAFLRADHPNYRARVELSPEARRSLAADLAGPGEGNA